MDFRKHSFIYGSFDTKIKGLRFPLVGKSVSKVQMNVIRKIAEDIGDFPNERSTVHSLVCEREGFRVLMKFSFQGTDELGRSTFISKGIVLTEKDYEKVDCYPFCLLEPIKANGESISREVKKGKLAPLTTYLKYSFEGVLDTYNQDKELLRSLTLAIWLERQLTLPLGTKFSKLLESVFLLSTIEQRKKISFVSCKPLRLKQISVQFKETANHMDLKIHEDPKLQHQFSDALAVTMRKNQAGYRKFLKRKLT